MVVTKGYTYVFEFKDVDGRIAEESVKDYDLQRDTPITRSLKKALELETEWVPLTGYFPNLNNYNKEVRLSYYYF